MSPETIAAVRKLVDWAEAYVENETVIPETPRDQLTDSEKGALMLIDLVREQP